MPIIGYKTRVIVYVVILAAILAHGIVWLSGGGRWPPPFRLNPSASSAVYTRNLGQADEKVYVIEARGRLKELYETMPDVSVRSYWVPQGTPDQVRHVLTLLDDQGNALSAYQITETDEAVFDGDFCECEETLELLKSWVANGTARELTEKGTRELYDASGK